MPWIDKSTSTTFALVHRPQNDPKIHDSSMVFQELAPSQAHKVKNRSDLESELFGGPDDGNQSTRLRDNEGEAAEYGVFFDDSEYDYLQHMRDLDGGIGDGRSHFIDATMKETEGKGKGKIPLDQALRDFSMEDRRSKVEIDRNGARGSGLLDEEILPSKNLRRTTYQDQQDVPDVLAGFQPDMDLRIREALEALDDEAYLDGKGDVFEELAKETKEISLAEFKELGFEGDIDGVEEEGWETDDTAKPTREFKCGSMPIPSDSADVAMDNGPDRGDGDWMKEFNKFKTAENSKIEKSHAANIEGKSSIMTGTSLAGGCRKKRKGAMTSSTGYSMTSSSLHRTKDLDARFAKVEEEYAEDDMDKEDDGESVVTGTSTASSQAPPTGSGFDSIMNEFLNEHSTSRRKKGKNQSGINQLREIREGLGPAKILIKAQAAQ
ncbi:hypothetical protein MMC07_006549 [Pseudocyphellaria aurata]|nr:hypothetical protein [Pseudocyphellaria aurata]